MGWVMCDNDWEDEQCKDCHMFHSRYAYVVMDSSGKHNTIELFECLDDRSGLSGVVLFDDKTACEHFFRTPEER